MNHENFMQWVRTQLLPNLPPNSVLVLDNAAYHNVPVEKNITTASRKQEMLDWLDKHKISYAANLTKPELYEIIKLKKASIPARYKLDVLMEAHGHKVVRLPPYHPDLNAIEPVWAALKNDVAAKNTTFKLDDVEKLARQRFTELGPEMWKRQTERVKKTELTLWQKEIAMDAITDKSDLVFTVNTGSSDESESDLSGIDDLA